VSGNSGLKVDKVDKKQTYTKTEACKLCSGVFWIFLPNVIKIDPYNFELYLFKVDAFFLRHSVGLKSSKLTAWTISPTPSLFVVQWPSTYSQGKIFGRLEVGWEKVACWSTKAAISLKRVKIEEKCLWKACRNSPTLFWMVPSPTPYGLPFPKIGVCTPPKIPTAVISGTGKAANFKFGQYIQSSIRTKAESPLKILEKRKRGRIQGLSKFFGYPLLSHKHEKLQVSNLASTFRGSIRTKDH